MQRLDPKPLLGSLDLVAMDQVGEVAQLVAERADLSPHHGQPLLTPGARLLGAGPLHGCLCERKSHKPHRVCRPATDRACHRGLALSTLSPGCGPLACRQLRASGGIQRLSPALHGSRPFLAGAKRQAQLGLLGAGSGGADLESVTLIVGGLLLSGFGAGLCQPLTEGEVVGAVTAQGALCPGDGPLDALGLATAGANRTAELPQPLGDRSHPGV